MIAIEELFEVKKARVKCFNRELAIELEKKQQLLNECRETS